MFTPTLSPMPRRNLLVLVAVTLVALLCYQRVQKNPYGHVLANAMTTIENRYIEPVQASKLFERAMDGMLDKLDDNSAYITPADLQEFQQSIDLQFEGVGMEVALDPQTKQLMVLSPLAGSPAYKAGIRAGDKILRIGADSTQGMSLRDAVGLLRGKPGTPVTLTVLHEGEEKPTEITIVRGTIQVDSVRGDTRRRRRVLELLPRRPPANRLRPHHEFHRQDGRRDGAGARVALGARHARPGARSARRSGRIPRRGGRRLRPVDPFRRDRHGPPPRRPHQSDVRRQRPGPVHRLPHGRARSTTTAPARPRSWPPVSRITTARWFSASAPTARGPSRR